MNDWLGIGIGAILLSFGLYYAWHVRSAATAGSQGFLQSQGLINNPYQDMSLYGSTQTTVDPLTGELLIEPGQSLFTFVQAEPIAGKATGTSTVT